MRQTDFSGFRRLLIGTPLPTSAHHEERYTNAEALAILSSDALSSVAYATQEIVLVLGLAGAAALPITGLIVGLMLIVATSYRQTIKAYPHGGGSYRVSQQNLSPLTGLVAGASLSIDYVLTVAVSVAAGIAALTSYFPALDQQRVLLCLVAVALVMMANLRGVSSSAKLLSLPHLPLHGHGGDPAGGRGGEDRPGAAGNPAGRRAAAPAGGGP